MKCLGCSAGGRGNSKPKRGEAMKGYGDGFLAGCQCPVDTALVELFTVKSTAGMKGIEALDDDRKKRDFFFNPVNLTLVRVVIAQVSGLDTETMFHPECYRLVTTAQWALEQLANTYFTSEESNLKIQQMITDIRKLLRTEYSHLYKNNKGKGKAKEDNLEDESMADLEDESIAD